MSIPVAVIGAGVKTPAGSAVDDLWRFLLAGRAAATRYGGGGLPPDIGVLVCAVDGFDPADYLTPPEVRRMDRATMLAVAAASDAMAAVTDLPPATRCAVVCGTGFGPTATIEDQISRFARNGLRAVSPLAIPMMMPNSAASLISQRLGFKGPCVTVSTACASGASAIGDGVELLRRGAADLVLAGGFDSMVTAAPLAGFLRLDAMSRTVDRPDLASRPFDTERDGFVMGEGAGFVVLVREGDRPTAAPLLGRILGYGACADAHHVVAPAPDGEGALRCMRLALDDAGATTADVNHVNAHGTATVANDRAEAAALTALFGPGGAPVTAVKGSTGHMIGGSGAVEAIVVLRSLAEGVAAPVAGLRSIDPAFRIDAVTGTARPLGPGVGLSNSFGFGGSNAVLVLST